MRQVGLLISKLGRLWRLAMPALDRVPGARACVVVARGISGLVSLEPDIGSVQLDGTQLRLEPAQTVFPHCPDRGLTIPHGLPPASGQGRSPPKRTKCLDCYR
jgi:hypothetical protein